MSDTPQKILVVDDNVTNLTVINGILNSRYKAYPVNSGAIALKFLERQRPDLILLDEEMPEMSGTELLKILKATPEYADIPVIFLTGNNDVESEAAAIKSGAADYIHKPVNDVIILSKIQTHLELDAYRRAARSAQ